MTRETSQSRRRSVGPLRSAIRALTQRREHPVSRKSKDSCTCHPVYHELGALDPGCVATTHSPLEDA